ncbi:Pls/PosA family non-ribosomal peptide synthetase [Actinomycetospora lemnae]|uniref:AMP-binding protein n=1 Tax=Actinomycetospora lemnae TaxID=3019891 RepID=A0ABT5SRF1_9PSEU|nr:Pls/PosA family non-ribosomal peptide synthetase [Actinomycetospora sp. DW7H6]MDD7964592.1 AMP-binding protein [Actinomycetospora sp. DW7H6]
MASRLPIPPTGSDTGRPLLRLAGPPAPDPSHADHVLIDGREAQGPRARAGERLDDLVAVRCASLRDADRLDTAALEIPDRTLSYGELDADANRLARYLRLHGVRGGDRVALRLDSPDAAHLALLALARLGAATVTVAPGLSPDDTTTLLADVGATTLLATDRDTPELTGPALAAGADVVAVDRAAALIAEQDPRALLEVESGPRRDALAYVVPTTDDAGLRATAVDHTAAVALVRVLADVLGLRPGDRVHRGAAPGSDLAVLETWLPWARGATVVVPPSGVERAPAALGRHLRAQHVSVLCAAPDLLAGIDEDLPDLRLVVVPGPAYPQDLVARWHRPGRRLVGIYGPPEATVAALWTELRPDGAATLGVPLPTGRVVVLDPGRPARTLPPGAVGEIGLAGAGVARGYVGRAELDRETFVPDPLGIPGNPSGRVVRTGDLGRATEDGEVEFLGRLVDAGGRGSRPTAMTVPRRAAVTVPVVPPLPPLPPPLPPSPPLPSLPPSSRPRVRVTTSAPPADSAPTVALSVAALAPPPTAPPAPPPTAPPATPPAPPATAPAPPDRTQALLAEILAGALDRDDVPVDAHVFDDLGADSMLMARFCARVRKHPDLPSIAMQDVYAHPTVAQLATALAPTTTLTTTTTTTTTTTPAPRADEPAPEPDPEPEPVPRAGRVAYVLCGAAQLLFVLGYTYVAATIVTWAFEWLALAPDELHLYLRSVAVGSFAFAVLSILPIALKWLLVGRWRPREFPIWGLTYLRLWIVRVLVQSSPLVLFVGTPIYPFYLRALGARVGKGAVLLSGPVPVCADLLTVGAGALVRNDVFLAGYRAHDGRIQTGPVTIGRDAVVGENVVLDIDTTIGDGATLGHSSSLHRGQSVPAGATWHGSPAREAPTAYPTVPPMRCGALRKVAYSVVSLAVLLAVVLPLAAGGTALLVLEIPQLRALIEPGPGALTSRLFWMETLLVSVIGVFGLVLVGLLVVTTLPRLFALGVRPDRVYALYGVHYWCHRWVSGLTNVTAFTYLFGDSSAIAHYLGRLGYRLRPLVQTGSNFGMAVKQENPYLTRVGSGTVVADGLSVMNADYSATSFRVSTTGIGARNFLGNRIHYPPQGRTGDDCLLATKVMVPVDGPVREGVGLLGSPSFEIPRSVARDDALDLGGDELARGLRRKNRHNATTMALFLLVRWWLFLGMAALVACIASVPVRLGAIEMLVAQLLIFVFGTLWLVLVERSVARLQCRAPEGRSIYDPSFWRHERFWKVALPDWVVVFNGTPYKNLVWRMLGVRIGKRVFDDGVNLTERTFTTIGDECTFNAQTVLQCHSQEDGAFKSEVITVGAGVTLGVGAFAHYGTTIGDGAVLAPDTFLMKGEEVPPGEYWGGNPARAMAPGTIPTGGRR